MSPYKIAFYRRSKTIYSSLLTVAFSLHQELASLDIKTLTPLSPEVISRQATINIGTIGHVAHGKSTVVKALSGVHTVRFKNELERNITIKLGYANAKIYKSDDPKCQRPVCYTSASSNKVLDSFLPLIFFSFLSLDFLKRSTDISFVQRK